MQCSVQCVVQSNAGSTQDKLAAKLMGAAKMSLLTRPFKNALTPFLSGGNHGSTRSAQTVPSLLRRLSSGKEAAQSGWVDITTSSSNRSNGSSNSE